MRMPRVCPRCHVLLVPVAEQDSLFVCRPCGGTLDLSAPHDGDSSASASGTDGLACPECLQPMCEEQVGNVAQHRCLSCGSLWLDRGDATPEQLPAVISQSEAASATFAQQLLYGLSLPERVLRTAVGVSAGTLREVATFLVPQAFQNSVTYQVAIRNSLNFLTERVGGFESGAEETTATDAYLAKKTVGNFVELAGLTLLPVSPMWLLAAMSDIAHGSSTYVKELAAELRSQGLIDETSTIDSIDELLEAIRASTGKVSTVFDQPPFSIDELQDVINETRAAVTSADVRKLVPEPEIRRYWEQLQQSARQQNASLWQMSTAVAMTTYRQLGITARGTATGVSVAQRMVSRNLLDHFRQSLQSINEEGFFTIVQRSYEPYVSRVYDNFKTTRKSWTEAALQPENMTGLWNWATSLLNRPTPSGQPTNSTPHSSQ